MAAAKAVPAGGPQAEGDPALLDRVPTAAQIFDFHPKGTPKSAWRDPFLISPDDGPLKLRKWSADDLAEAPAPAATPLPRKLGENAAALRQVHVKPPPYPPPLLGTAPPPYPTDR